MVVLIGHLFQNELKGQHIALFDRQTDFRRVKTHARFGRQTDFLHVKTHARF